MFIERAPRLIRPLNYPAGTPGRGAAMIDAKNGAQRARHQRHGPHLHGPARRSLRRGRSRNRRLCRSSSRPTPSSSTCMPRPPARSRRWAISATAAPASWSARIRMRRPPIIGYLTGGTAFMSDVGMTGDYDSVIGMTQGRAAVPFRATNFVGPFRGGGRSRQPCAASPSRLTIPDGLGGASRRCGWAAGLNRRRRVLGVVFRVTES